MKNPFFTYTCILIFLGLSSCEELKIPDIPEKPAFALEEVASSEDQWTGVAVSQQQRIFVNFPRWSRDHTKSVAEIVGNNEFRLYPNEEWNKWEPSMDPASHWVSVQTVFIDDENFLWVLDPANPQYEGEYQGVVEGGAKLVKIDLETDEVIQTIVFPMGVVKPNSYLNDVRIDTELNFAYITDSNEDALVVADLSNEESWRLLDDHFSTHPELPLVIDGEVWKQNGEIALVGADGIALDSTGEYLYYHALTGYSLYRIETKYLRNPSLAGEDLGSEVEFVAKTGATDGIKFGHDGGLYHSNMEHYAIKRYTPETGLETVVQSEKLKWPDSFSVGPENYLYVTTSKIHIPDPDEPYKLFRIKLR